MTDSYLNSGVRQPSRSTVLKYTVDVWPVGLVLVVAALSLLPFLRPMPLWQLALVWVAVVYLRTFCAFVQHNHAHLPVFKHRIMNRLFDVLLTQNTGYPSAIWQLHHNLGHHRNFLDPERDVARTTYPGSTVRMSRWVYALRGNSTILRDSIRIGLGGPEKRQQALLLKLALEILVQLVITACLFATKPWLALCFFLIPNAFTGFLVWWESYPHHLGVPSTSIYDSSVTSEARDYNFMTFNIGHHTAHHQKPTLHWSLLPQQTAKIRHLIHGSCLKADHKTLGRRFATSGKVASASARASSEE